MNKLEYIDTAIIFKDITNFQIIIFFKKKINNQNNYKETNKTNKIIILN